MQISSIMGTGSGPWLALITPGRGRRWGLGRGWMGAGGGGRCKTGRPERGRSFGINTACRRCAAPAKIRQFVLYSFYFISCLFSKRFFFPFVRVPLPPPSSPASFPWIIRVLPLSLLISFDSLPDYSITTLDIIQLKKCPRYLSACHRLFFA